MNDYKNVMSYVVPLFTVHCQPVLLTWNLFQICSHFLCMQSKMERNKCFKVQMKIAAAMTVYCSLCQLFPYRYDFMSHNSHFFWESQDCKTNFFLAVLSLNISLTFYFRLATFLAIASLLCSPNVSQFCNISNPSKISAYNTCKMQVNGRCKGSLWLRLLKNVFLNIFKYTASSLYNFFNISKGFVLNSINFGQPVNNLWHMM